jgi:hypothetical protein
MCPLRPLGRGIGLSVFKRGGGRGGSVVRKRERESFALHSTTSRGRDRAQAGVKREICVRCRKRNRPMRNLTRDRERRESIDNFAQPERHARQRERCGGCLGCAGCPNVLARSRRDRKPQQGAAQYGRYWTRTRRSIQSIGAGRKREVLPAKLDEIKKGYPGAAFFSSDEKGLVFALLVLECESIRFADTVEHGVDRHCNSPVVQRGFVTGAPLEPAADIR